MDDDTSDLENIPTKDEETNVHDQLPSVEEAKVNAALDGAKPTGSTARVLKIVGALVFIALLVLSIGLGLKSKSKKSETPSGVYGDREDAVIEFLLLETGTKSENLKLLQSPQRKAAKWIADLDKAQVSMDDKDTFLQRYALAVFYFSTNGPNWDYSLGFLGQVDSCGWYQIGFSSEGNPRYVGAHCRQTQTIRQLFFPEQWLIGSLPDELELLTDLEYISVYRNSGLGGGEIPSVLQKMTKLQYLGLHHCQMEGTIPNWIGDMTSLTTLLLSNNKLTGEIPQSIQELTHMRQLFLDDNKITGDISSLQSMTKLEALLLEDNNFHGAIDDTLLDKWSKMQVMDISNNKLNSSIPKNLFSMPNLAIADMHKNNFHGELPEIEEANEVLEFVALHKNKISGTIPKSIYRLQKLSHLDVSNNTLEGDFPIEMETLVNMKYLFLGNNEFTEGPFPPFLSNLKKLEDLSLKDTQRTGHLPDWFDKLTSLVLLDLDNNKFSGMIPQNFGALTQLRYLLLNNNLLEGAVPNTFSALTGLEFLLLDQNSIIAGAENAVCSNPDVNPSVFIADCGSKNLAAPELECTCCSLCCQDDDESCNDVIWTGSFDPIWETNFERNFYRFEQITLPLT